MIPAEQIVGGLTQLGRALVMYSVQGTLLLLATSAVAYLLRRRSAAIRHGLWGVALGSLLLLPALNAWGPRFEIPGVPAKASIFANDLSVQAPAISHTTFYNPSHSARAVVADEKRVSGTAKVNRDEKVRIVPVAHISTVASPPIAKSRTWSSSLVIFVVAIVAWGFGVLFVASRAAYGVFHVRKITRAGVPLTDERWNTLLHTLVGELRIRRPVRVLVVAHQHVPLTWGILHPTILLPPVAQEWAESQRLAVLTHELAHVARIDALVQVLGQVAAAIFWFNPLVWGALRCVRNECEQACDDLVVRTGLPPVTYADTLVRIARSAYTNHTPARLTWSGSLAMARPTGLETRVRAILTPTLDRRPLAVRDRVTLCAVVGCIALPMTALRPVTAPKPVAKAHRRMINYLTPHTKVASQTNALPVSALDTYLPGVPQIGNDTIVPDGDKQIASTDSFPIIALTPDQITTYIRIATALRQFWSAPEHAALEKIADSTTRSVTAFASIPASDHASNNQVTYSFFVSIYDYQRLVKKDAALAEIFQSEHVTPDQYVQIRMAIASAQGHEVLSDRPSIFQQNATLVKAYRAQLEPFFPSMYVRANVSLRQQTQQMWQQAQLMQQQAQERQQQAQERQQQAQERQQQAQERQQQAQERQQQAQERQQQAQERQQQAQDLQQRTDKSIQRFSGRRTAMAMAALQDSLSRLGFQELDDSTFLWSDSASSRTRREVIATPSGTEFRETEFNKMQSQQSDSIRKRRLQSDSTANTGHK